MALDKEQTERIVLVSRADWRAFNATDQPSELGQAWLPVLDGTGNPHVFRGTKAQVIEAAYESLGADDGLEPGKEISFRAPSLSAWKGERVIRVPDHPKPERLWRD